MSKSESAMLKGIAVLMMLFHHLFYKPERYVKYGWFGYFDHQGVFIFIAKNFKVCVSLFVVITGFGLLMVEKKYRQKHPESQGLFKDLRRMYKKALSRYWDLIRTLLYIMVVALVITHLLGADKTLMSVYKSVVDATIGFVLNVTGLAFYFGVKWFNNSWWYTAVAVAYILLFPILYISWKKISPIITCVMIGVVDLVLFFMNISIPNILLYMPVLLFGMLCAEYDILDKIFNWAHQHIWRRIGLILLSCIVYIAASWVKEYLVNKDGNFMFYVVMVFAVLLVVKLGISSIPGVRKVLEVLGVNSRYMWLIHVFIYSHWFTQPLYHLQNVWLIYFVLVASSLALSWILRFIFEFSGKQIKKFIRR